jgi:hypothetical protein
MADTPDNQIEKLLKDYAQQRREAAGTPELHPATRRILQDEVRQQFGRPVAPAPSRSWAGRFWPRFALTSGALGVLVLMAFLLIPHGDQTKRMTLAKLEKDKNQATAVQKPSVPSDAAVPASAPTFATREQAREREPAKTLKLQQAQAANELARALPESGATPRTAAADQRVSPAFAAPTVANASTSADKVKSRAGVERSTGPTLSTALSKTLETPAYRTAATAMDSKTSLQPVLGEFTLQQTGETLVVVDRDGSVYKGTIQPVATPLMAMQTAKAVATDFLTTNEVGGISPATQAEPKTMIANAPSPKPQTGGVSFAFRVEGTNLILNQRVIFTGTLQQPPSANTTTALAATRTFQRQPAPNAAPAASTITGQLQLGDGKPDALNATSVSP